MRFADLIERKLWQYVTRTGIVLCGIGKSDPPEAPDPYKLAEAQKGTNIATANATTGLARPDIIGPSGSQTWTMREGADPKNPKPGDWIQTNSLSPELQSQLTQRNALSGQVLSGLQTPMDFGNLPARGEAPQSQGVNNVADALYHKQTAMLDPQFKNQDDELASRLANQGITQGSEAYNRAMEEQARNKEYSYGQARDASILAGGAEDTRQFNQSLATGNFMNDSRVKALAEAITRRQLPLNELNSFLSGSQMQMPNFQAPGGNGTVGGVDLGGMVNNAYNQNLAQTNAQNAQTANTWGQVGSLAKMAFL